jgi:hypothetical protein
LHLISPWLIQRGPETLSLEHLFQKVFPAKSTGNTPDAVFKGETQARRDLWCGLVSANYRRFVPDAGDYGPKP